MGRQARRLGDHGAVHVDELPACGLHGAQGFGQQHGRIGAFELGVGVGEMAANVAQAGRAQQCVGDGVQQGVGIRMAQQANAVRNLDATQHQPTPRHQGVHIPALTHTQFHDGSFLANNKASASKKSAG